MSLEIDQMYIEKSRFLEIMLHRELRRAGAGERERALAEVHEDEEGLRLHAAAVAQTSSRSTQGNEDWCQHRRELERALYSNRFSEKLQQSFLAKSQ